MTNEEKNGIIEASEGKNEIKMTPEVQEATDKLRAFLFENVYLNPVAKSEEVKAQSMLTELFEYFVKHPEKMPELYTRNLEAEGVRRCVCDYISGMTDRYAIETYRRLFIPEVWKGRVLHD